MTTKEAVIPAANACWVFQDVPQADASKALDRLIKSRPRFEAKVTR